MTAVPTLNLLMLSPAERSEEREVYTRAGEERSRGPFHRLSGRIIRVLSKLC